MVKLDYSRLFDLYANGALVSMLKARNLHQKQTRKADMVAALVASVEDEAGLRAAYAALSPGAQVLLAQFRELGGRAKVDQLKMAASRAGVGGFDGHLHELMRYALVLYASPGSTKHELWRVPPVTYGWRPITSYEVVAVPGALALVDREVTLPALHLAPFEGEIGTVREESPTSLLHGMFMVVRWAKSRQVKIAKTTGAIAKTDLRALVKQANCDEEWANFLSVLAVSAGLLRAVGNLIQVSATCEGFFKQPPREQVQALYKGWLNLGVWSEFVRIPEIEFSERVVPPEPAYGDNPTASDLRRARAFLMGLLTRSAKLGQWFSLASLIEAVKSEDAEFLIPRQRERFYYSYGRNSNTYSGFWKAGGKVWHDLFSKDTDWELVEGRYIRQVLSEPLCWLGLVALSCDARGEVVAFRLTPLGASVLGLDTEGAAALEAAQDALAITQPLIVQPNFEIIAYTEAEHLPVLFELERFAERMSADRVAHYRLTRDSVYRGLQEGLSAAVIQEFLTRHSQTPLPQNIAYSLDDWQRLHDRVHVHRTTTLLEAGSEAEMDELLARLPEGVATRLTPTWALLKKPHTAATQQALAATGDIIALDYSREVQEALTATDELRLRVSGENLDLWLLSRLEQFSRREKETSTAVTFQITPESLAHAKEMGVSHREVIAFLEKYGKTPLPSDVLLTLQGWGGDIGPAAFVETVALVVREGLIPQLVAVEELRELMWLKVSERVVLVKQENVAALQEALARRGIQSDANPRTYLTPPAASKARPAVTRTWLPKHRRVSVEEVITVPKPRTSIPTAGATSAAPASDVPLEYNLPLARISEMLESAIDDSRCVMLDYQSRSGNRKVRKVDPLLIEIDGETEYLSGWCHLSSDFRAFRVDRIQGLALLDERYDPDEYGEVLDTF